MIYGKVLFIGLLSFCLWLPSLAIAAQMEIHPYLTVSEQYDDNINLTPDNEEEDWVTTVAPGFSLNYGARSLDATVDYSLHYIFYKNNSEDNQDTFKDVQRANVQLLFFPGRAFTLTISENITREAIDERDVFSPDNQRINMTTVYSTRVSPQYSWRLSPTFSLVFGYDYQRTDYTEGEADDGQDHTGRVSLVKILSATLESSLNYSCNRHLADVDMDDYDEQNISLGLTYQPSSRTSLALQGGLSSVDYNDGSDSTEDASWSVDLSHRLTNVLSTNLSFSQNFSTSASLGLERSRQAAWGLTWERQQLTVAGEIYWQQSDFLQEDRQDDAYGTRLSLSQQFSRRLSGAINGDYERAEFDDPGPDEQVDRYSLGGSLSYSFSRFVTSLAYRHRINQSNVDNNDYTNNTVTLTASVRF
jgi:hypothetical protein